MNTSIPMPEIELIKRQLHFFWITDGSGSMYGQKIATLNQAIREAIPEIRKVVAAQPEVEVFMRAIRFADDATWHVGPTPVRLEQFTWPEMSCDGGTSTEKAIRLLRHELAMDKMPRRGARPVVLLISDGMSSDSNAYRESIKELLSENWGKKTIRVAIAIAGQSSDYDIDQLAEFVSDDVRESLVGAGRPPVLEAHNATELINYIRWASTVPTRSSSQNPSQVNDPEIDLVLTPPDNTTITSSKDPF